MEAKSSSNIASLIVSDTVRRRAAHLAHVTKNALSLWVTVHLCHSSHPALFVSSVFAVQTCLACPSLPDESNDMAALAHNQATSEPEHCDVNGRQPLHAKALRATVRRSMSESFSENQDEIQCCGVSFFTFLFLIVSTCWAMASGGGALRLTRRMALPSVCALLRFFGGMLTKNTTLLEQPAMHQFKAPCIFGNDVCIQE